MLEFEGVIRDLERNRDRAIDVMDRTPSEAWSDGRSGERWSIGEIVDHLAVVEVRTGRLITRHLTLTVATEQALAEAAEREAVVRRAMEDPTPRVAPAMVEPEGRWGTREDTIAAFLGARKETIDFARGTGLSLGSHIAPHPVFGPLTGVQWLFFLAHHTERHLRQIEQLLSPATPD